MNQVLPESLVVTMTTLYQPCSGNVGVQIQAGNTFAVPFDLSHVHGQSGTVYLTTDAENNFQAAEQMTLAPEGLAGKVAFMSIGTIQATVFGETETVTRSYIVGTPEGTGYSWQAGIIVGGCIVTNGVSDDAIIAKLKGDS
ncbi:MAG: hypothetical protein AB1757_20935 [Acidobacteriota bacterium]